MPRAVDFLEPALSCGDGFYSLDGSLVHIRDIRDVGAFARYVRNRYGRDAADKLVFPPDWPDAVRIALAKA